MKKHVITLIILSALLLTLCGCDGFPFLSGAGAKKLYNAGIKAVEAGDYETAENYLHQAVAKGYTDNNASTLHKAVNIYNDAAEDIDDGNYAAALSIMKDMPKVYKQFDVFRDDVEDLRDELDNYKDNIALYEQAMRFYENGLPDSAAESALKTDTKYLSDAQKDSVTLILKNVQDEKQKKENEERSEDRGKTTPPSAYTGVFSDSSVKRLMNNYAWRLIDAINSNNYSVVSPYIYPGSNLSAMQAKLITNLNKQGTTERMDSLDVIDIYPLNETMCAITTYEVATIFYSDGNSETKTYNWKYTAKIYDDGTLRLTNIERN